jgi:hypothetical protein
MPKIPIYQQRVSIPGEAASTPGSLAVAGAEGEGIAKLGAAGLHVTNEFADIIARQNEQLRLQNNAAVISNVKSKILTDTVNWRQNFETTANQSNLDPDGLHKMALDSVKGHVESLKQSYLTDSITDPQQRLHIQDAINNAEPHALDFTSTFEANYRTKYMADVVSNVTTSLVDAVRKGQIDYDSAIETSRAQIIPFHTTGAISAAEAEDKITKSDQAVTVSYFDSLTPQMLVEKLKDSKFTQYLPETEYRRLEAKVKNELVAQAKIDGNMAENDILDSLGRAISAPGIDRETFIKDAERKLTDYSAARKLTPEDRVKYTNMIRDYREGKDQPTNQDTLLEAKIGLYSGKLTVDDVKRMGGINAADKGPLISLYYQVERQFEASQRTIAAGERAAKAQIDQIRRGEFGRMLEESKNEIMLGAITDSDKKLRQSMFSQYAESAWKNFGSGGDAWDFKSGNLFKYQGQGEMPFVVIKGVYQGNPKTALDVGNLKQWVPVLVKQGRVKEANDLSDKLKKADIIIKYREARNNAGSATTERKQQK